MRLAPRSTAAFGACIALAAPADACSPQFKPWWANKSVRHAPNCSFSGGGRNDFLSGAEAKDLGDGRIVQVISDFGSQSAIVTDCKSSEQLQVHGTWPAAQSAACESPMKYEMFTPPKGSLDVTLGASLTELEEQLLARGYQAKRTIKIGVQRAKGRDVPDFYCGCKRHYPKSAGATK